MRILRQDSYVKLFSINHVDHPLMIWDQKGPDKIQSIVRNHWKGTHGASILYDITSERSFEMAEMWANELEVF